MQVRALIQEIITKWLSEQKGSNLPLLIPGEIFTARVKSVDGSLVTINFKGKEVVAFSKVPVEPGQEVTFEFLGVKNNQARLKILSQVLIDNNDLMVKIENFLRSWGLSENDLSKEIAYQMIKQGMPLEKDLLSIMVKEALFLSITNKEIPALVFLFKNELPLTAPSVKAVMSLMEGSCLFQRQIIELKELLKQNKMTDILPEETKNLIDSLLVRLEAMMIKPDSGTLETALKIKALLNFFLDEGRTFIKSIPESLVRAQVFFRESGQVDMLNNIEIINKKIAGFIDIFKGFEILNSPIKIVDKPPEQLNLIRQQSMELQDLLVKLQNSKDLPSELKKQVADLLSLIGHFTVKLLAKPHEASFKTWRFHDLINESPRLMEVLERVADFIKNIKEHESLNNKINELLESLNRFQASGDDINETEYNLFLPGLIKDDNNKEKFINLTIKYRPGKKQKTIQNNSWTLHITQETNNLGPVNSTLQVYGNLINCSFSAVSKEIADFITEERDALNEALQRLGFKVNFLSPKIVGEGTMEALPSENFKTVLPCKVDIMI